MTNSKLIKEIYMVLTTEANKNNACKIANVLLREKLISCATFKDVESHFWWEGKINQSNEIQLILKCKKENIHEVCKKISETHSYKVPEIVYFPVKTNDVYHQWLYSINK